MSSPKKKSFKFFEVTSSRTNYTISKTVLLLLSLIYWTFIIHIKTGKLVTFKILIFYGSVSTYYASTSYDKCISAQIKKYLNW